MSSDGPLGRLLALALSAVVDDLHDGLVGRGWMRTRPLWGFVLLSLRDEPRSVSQIGLLLGVTKQAAAKVVDGLAEAGLVRRDPDPTDRRGTLVHLTEDGTRFLGDAEAVYAEIEAGWAEAIGERRLCNLRGALETYLSARFGDDRPPIRPAL